MKYIFLFSIITVSFLSSCKEDHDHNEGELITTLMYTLSNPGNETVVFSFSDKDGDGGIAPIVTTSGVLKSGLTYSGTLSVRNDSTNSVVDITEEIAEEDEDHQFFFIPNSALAGKLTIQYDDKDGKNNPIGLKTKAIVSGSGNGKLKIILRHLPNKGGVGVGFGDIINAGGETDIEVEFDVTIQ